MPTADTCAADFAPSLAGLLDYCARNPAPDGRQIEAKVFNMLPSLAPVLSNMFLRTAFAALADWAIRFDGATTFHPYLLHELLAADGDSVGAGYRFYALFDERPALAVH